MAEESDSALLSSARRDASPLGETRGTDLAEHQLAVNDFSRAIELDPDYAEAYFSRGVLYWRELRNAYRAIRDMTRVLELAPQVGRSAL